MEHDLDPELWELPDLQAALVKHDFTTIFSFLTGEAEGSGRVVSQRQLARLLDRSQSEIHEIIHGRQVRMYAVLEHFAARLKIPRGYLGLAFTSNPDSNGKPEPEPGETATHGDGEKEDDAMQRRRFVQNAAAASFGSAVLGPVTEFIIPFTYPEIRSRVGVADVKRVRDLTAFTRWQDARHGEGSCADLLSRELPGIFRLLKANMKDALRVPLLTAIADAYMVAGASRADTGDVRTARAMFARALTLAEEAGGRSLLANVLLRQACVDGRDGHIDDALKLVQFANAAMPHGLSSSEAAGYQAWLYAQLGIPEQATTLLKTARDLYEKHHTDDRLPPWLTDFNSVGPVGMAEGTLRELSAHDSAFLDRAVPASVAAIPKVSEPRGRVLIATSRAADLHLRAGERARGLQLAEDAVNTAEGLCVVPHHTKQALRTDLTRMLTACRDSTAADLSRRIAVLAA